LQLILRAFMNRAIFSLFRVLTQAVEIRLLSNQDLNLNLDKYHIYCGGELISLIFAHVNGLRLYKDNLLKSAP
jgi:hypothetical protein